LSDIWVKFVQLTVTGELTRHVLVSLNEFFVGFALAAVVGIGLGIAIASSDTARDFIDPWVSAVYAAPTVALAPLFIFIFQIDAMWVGVFLLAGTGVLAVIVLQNVERRLAPWRQFELK